MALSQNSDITISSLVTNFKTEVVDKILTSNIYHEGKPPVYNYNGTYGKISLQCIPTSYLDHIDRVSYTPNVGVVNEQIEANTILNGLIDIVRDLTRVGSFKFNLYYKSSTGGQGTINPDRTISPLVEDFEKLTSGDGFTGRVLFSRDFIRQYNGPTNKSDTINGATIKASNLNTLLSNIFNDWSNISRYEYVTNSIICHTVCHGNCHNNCHVNCHNSCHGLTSEIKTCHSNSEYTW